MLNYVCMYVWTDFAHEPIKSAHKYQDRDFRDEMSLSDTSHPLLPTVLDPVMLQT